VAGDRAVGAGNDDADTAESNVPEHQASDTDEP
jgi:hypothetical protein